MIQEGEIDELSSRSSSYPRDLLRRFAGGEIGGDETPTFAGGADTGEVELSLGLSLGGCFGVEPREKTRLVRASSISTLSMFPIEWERVPLERTWSLPAETEEEMRKRKEMQSLKRLEAKRKRSEKKAAMTKDRKEDNLLEEEKLVNGVVIPAELPRWGGGGGGGGGGGRPASQGSIGSQGSSSSGVSDFESGPMPLGINGAEVRSTTTLPSPFDHAKTTNPSKEIDNPSKTRTCTTNNNGIKETERNMMEEMPCVSTKGDGPNGRKIEGFLYRYRKGEEVRIVCVCHGIFLTPAEFVKHAGGGDVAHPLRHIVVSPSPAGFS